MKGRDMVRLQRSILLVPGTLPSDEVRRLIEHTTADLVCLDLEDTVVAHCKAAARELIVDLLEADIWGRSRRAVRINPLSTHEAQRDIEHVIGRAAGRIDSLLLSKAETVEEIRHLDAAIASARPKGTAPTRIGYVVGIESAGAMSRIDALASASPNVDTLGLAAGDLSISLGINLGAYLRDRRSYPGDLFHFHRSRLVLAARTHGLMALDFPWPIIPDLETLDDEARRGMMLGMDGKMALSPEQVPVIHRAYAPSAAEVARFRQMIEIYEQCAAAGQGSASSDGEFIDPVTLGLAQRVLARSEAPI